MGCLYIHVHDSITDNSQKMQLKCPSRNEWVNKLWCEQTVEHYSPLKWKEISDTCDNMAEPRGHYAK